MSMLAPYIRPTNIVRQVMYKHGRTPRWEVWTNNYKNCHTVKCYAAGPATDAAMVAEITAVLFELGVPHQVRSTKASSMFRRGAIIIRLPKAPA